MLISDGDTVLKHLHTSVLIVGDYYKGNTCATVYIDIDVHKLMSILENSTPFSFISGGGGDMLVAAHIAQPPPLPAF